MKYLLVAVALIACATDFIFRVLTDAPVTTSGGDAAITSELFVAKSFNDITVEYDFFGVIVE